MHRHPEWSPWSAVKPELVENLADCLRGLSEAQIEKDPALLAWSAALVARAFPDIAAAVFRSIGAVRLETLADEQGVLMSIELKMQPRGGGKPAPNNEPPHRDLQVSVNSN
jgi:hypothetical protein